MYYDLEDYEVNIFYSEEYGDYTATTLEIPSISAYGETQVKALKNLKTTFKQAKEIFMENNDEMPEPLVKKNYSGQFRIRIPRDLHYELTKASYIENVSINQITNYLLAKGIEGLYQKKQSKTKKAGRK